MAKIKINLNGKITQIEENSSISDLIENLGFDVKKIAIEKNLEIIFPDQYKLEIINSDDIIEMIHFIGGG
ncbi:sulfur carrier protein ThiS [Rickettsiales bacterium]|nr:sulfur carrier protein ThiS [Rickettsiales bacterium]